MNITLRKENGIMTLAPEGRLTAIEAEEIEQALVGARRQEREVVLDLENVSYVSSAILRVILSAKKTLGEDVAFSVINMQKSVHEIFATTGFDQVIDIKNVIGDKV